MPLETWIAFALASAALLAIPGPTVMLVVSYTLGKGRASGMATIPGISFGNFAAMTISLLGAGAILATSAALFTVLKFAGAAYLIWLGVKLWCSEPSPKIEVQKIEAADKRGMFWNSFAITALNPKSIVFFTAFLPQFVDTTAPILPQFATLEATFIVLGVVNAALWAVLAGEVRARFLRPATLRIVNRVGGGFLIAAGLLTAATRRTN